MSSTFPWLNFYDFILTDKNLDNAAEAAEQFKLIQAAYDVLATPGKSMVSIVLSLSSFFNLLAAIVNMGLIVSSQLNSLPGLGVL